MDVVAAVLLAASCRSADVPGPARGAPADLMPAARVEVWRSLADDLDAPRAPSDGGGTVTLVEGPDAPVPAGGSARFHLAYRAGTHGVAAGGSVWFQAPPFWGWSPPVLDVPDVPGATRVWADADGVHLEPEVLGDGLLRIGLSGRALAPGDTVHVVYGDGASGARVDRFAERGAALWFAVDGDGDGVRAWVDAPVRVDVVAGPPVRLHVVAPSTARPGASMRVTVAALDAQGNAAEGEGVVVLGGTPGLRAPEAVPLRGGRAVVDVVAVEPGVQRLAAGVGEGLVGLSDPIVVHPDARTVLWADLQVHTALSDGTGTLDDVYAYARDVANLDAVAITDHDHWGVRFLDGTPEAWAEGIAAADRWDDPGRFVAFPAYEWTSWLYGHRHVLYVGTPGPVFGSVAGPTRDPDGLWSALAPFDAITIAHHTAGGPVPVDWRYRPDPRVEPVVEIASVHGSSEARDAPGPIYGWVDGHGVRDALLAGHRFGFVGSTDGHDGHPGLAHLVAGAGGLAAILTDDRTRAGVAAALRARRTYATNGRRILLRVDVPGWQDGGRVPLAPFAMDVRVVGTAPITAVELVRGPEVVARRTPEAVIAHEVFDVPDPEPGTFLYVRVVQADGGAAWSSPVWPEPGLTPGDPPGP